MIDAKPYPEEQKRLEALRSLHLLDTPIEERFERITRMVCRLLDVPMCMFNLVDEDRQYYKATHGMNNPTESNRVAALCTHTIHEPDMMIIPNALVDERFFDNPYVNGEWMNIEFYAGVPVRTNGMPVGTLCAMDTRPRDLTAEQKDTLRDLAAMVETELKVANLSKAHTTLFDELDKAQRLALIDPLTRLWNRAGINNLLDKEWAEAARHKKPVTLVIADIDHFKKVNDTHGHPVGDAVIQGAAKRLLEALRAEDAVGRIGGEEFLMILTDCLPEKVFETVDRIRHAISDFPMSIDRNSPLSIGMDALPVTMSFGAATIVPGPGVTHGDLIKRADDALYKAKKNGRNRVELAE